MPLLFLILSEDLQTTARTSAPSLKGPQMVCTLKHPGFVAISHAARQNNHIQESTGNDKYVRTAAWPSAISEVKIIKGGL